MGGPNTYGGLPPGLKRQAAAANWIDTHADVQSIAIQCQDPNIIAMAKTMACAIKESRPTVTLPPHIFIPWRAKPWFVETRWVLNGSNVAAVANGALASAAAEGITAVTEFNNPTTVNAIQASGTTVSGIFTVPKGYVAILRQWAAQTDDGGYFQDTSTGLPFVRFSLVFDGLEPTILSPGLLGNDGDLEHPFDVSYVIPENHTVAVLARNTDTNMWHLIETFMKGYLVEAREVNDLLSGLNEAGSCR